MTRFIRECSEEDVGRVYGSLIRSVGRVNLEEFDGELTIFLYLLSTSG